MPQTPTRTRKRKRGLAPAAAVGAVVGFLPPLMMEIPDSGDILVDIAAFGVRMLIGSVIGAVIGISVASLGYMVMGKAR